MSRTGPDVPPVARSNDALSAPVTGDVLVASDVAQPRQFTVAQAPHAPSLRCDTRRDALALARAFAAAHDVEAWLSIRGTTTRLDVERRP